MSALPLESDLLYSCAHFLVEIDEKSSLNGDSFNTI